MLVPLQTPGASPARVASMGSYSRSSARAVGSRASVASTAATSAGAGSFRPLQPPAAAAGAADDQSRPPLPSVPLYTTKVPAGDLQVRSCILHQDRKSVV